MARALSEEEYSDYNDLTTLGEDPEPIRMIVQDEVDANIPGASLYQTNCAICHLPDGIGITNYIPPLISTKRVADLLSPWIETSAIKDHIWKTLNGKAELEYAPLGHGTVDFYSYFEESIKHNIIGPTTIHYEYDLGGAEHGKKDPTMGLEEISNYLKNDLAWLKNKYKDHDILKLF